MRSQRDCRQVELALLLDDRGDHAEYQAVRAHVETCRPCQQRLEETAGSEEWWSDCRELLGSIDGEEKGSGPISRQIERIKPAGSDEMGPDPFSGRNGFRDPSYVSRSSLPPEQLLDPPSHPEMLGRVGRYDIERLLGRGGMGTVFKGYDSELNRPVAIKMLALHLAGDGTARQRFAREARAAAAIVHEHVVAIHDVQAAADVPFLVMQYVSGVSLQEHVDRHGPLETREVIGVALQVAAGLAAAHAQGVIHRDVKPANIMLEGGLGRVVITDFGLARAADECSLTRSGALAGTPHYMSPEQADAAPLDARTDLFSLGSVIYFMATGRPPFRAERPMAVLKKICHDRPLPLERVNPETPAPLAALLERLLEKDPDRRFQSAEELREVLAAYLAHLRQPNAVPVPREIRRSQSRRRSKLTALAAGLAALIGVALGAVFFPFSQPPDEPFHGSPVKTPDAAAGVTTTGVSGNAAAFLDELTPLEVIDREFADIRSRVQHLEQNSQASLPLQLDSIDRWDREAADVSRRLQELEQFVP